MYVLEFRVMSNISTRSSFECPIFGVVEPLAHNVLPTIEDVLKNFLYIKYNEELSNRHLVKIICLILTDSVSKICENASHIESICSSVFLEERSFFFIWYLHGGISFNFCLCI